MAIDRLRQAGADVCTVTLQTGLGSFRPVEVEDPAEGRKIEWRFLRSVGETFVTVPPEQVTAWEDETGLDRNEYFAAIPSLPISYEAATPIFEALAAEFPDRTVVTATIEENSTGELQFGVAQKMERDVVALSELALKGRGLRADAEDLDATLGGLVTRAPHHRLFVHAVSA